MRFFNHFAVFLAIALIGTHSPAAPVCSAAADNLVDLQSVADGTKDCEKEQKAADAICVERKVDENAIRDRVTKALGDAPVKFKEFSDKFKNGRSPAELAKLFRDTNAYYAKFFRMDEALQSYGPQPTPILEWINDTKFSATTADAESLKKAFVEKYVAFAKRMDCNPIISTETYPLELSVPKKVTSQGKRPWEYEQAVADFKREIAKPETIQAAKEEVARVNSHAENNLMTCSPNLHTPDERSVVGYTFPPCAGNFKQYFADNEFKISRSALDQIMADPNAKSLVECIKSSVAKGAKINHITISASANSLNNGGDAAKKFCPKGFRGLSNARAQSAQEVILPAVFAGSAVDFNSVTPLINISDSGTNGNGTSGPCVYTKDQKGQEVIKPEVLKALNLAEQKKKNPNLTIDPASQEILDSLEAAKNVSVQVTFDENTVGAKENIKFYAPRVSCRSIRFTCPTVQK